MIAKQRLPTVTLNTLRLLHILLKKELWIQAQRP
jgi:hypothetical protein